ncbi:aldehyde dehydrogenase [Nocardia speluncae]|uniref:Aldehyde dehydrogenase n=1 Tax=Nocardia speluncae TaxID=419477 RepID=A0A846XJJ2_9NOCA|nr:aldehyde dehydrogenase [Nocardia speluncae]NKY36398.1 aldehyde dehydrogenase [Nocardia speluncae]
MMNFAHIDGIVVSTDHWIGGERVSSARRFDDHSPIDGGLLARVSRGGAAEADLALSAATKAFPEWRDTPIERRAAILRRMHDLIIDRTEDFARVETADQGGLLSYYTGERGIRRSASNFSAFADMLLERADPAFAGDGHHSRVSITGTGPVVLINPWNGPLLLESWKVAPALAAGNTVVLKPSEWTPLTASLLADISVAAGLPPGVLNVVQGLGEEVGALLVADPRVRRISFTGSVPTARAIAAAAAPNLTPCSFELGGKSPFVVFADADLDAAVRTARRQYSNAGQVCLIGSRLLLAEEIYEEFLDRFTAAMDGFVVGDPRNPHTDMGPLIHHEQFQRVDGFVQRSLRDGARAVFGGGPLRDDGSLYYRPTLLVDMEPGAEIVTEEVFGPVLTAQSFASEDEAIAMANGTRYGLTATLFTGDEIRAERVAARLDVGTVWVNCFWIRDLRAPFGGTGESGVGREGGEWSFDFYSEVKNTVTGE